MKRDLVLGRSFAVLAASVLLSMLARKFVKSNKKSMHREADDTDASSSSAASAVSNSYDVFLSFSGEDTRRTFTDHLYKGLVEAGICVFRDNMLPEGEKIGINLFQAIKNSKISIAILSPNYASSEWCLEELVEMTECIKSGHIVLPIFYHVEPTHVGKQKGSFGKTFSRLSSNYVKEDVAKWKQALREVASIKGRELKKTADGHEGDLVEMVVRDVSSELKAFQPVVTEQLVGINNAVEDIFRLLDDNPSATQIVGIYGMGGIGKTTLAKFIHKKLSDQFKYRSLILDIRESSRRNGIFYLQNQLIRDLKVKDQASNKDEGISLLGSRFKRKKVLILLDDVDDIEQIRALVGEYDWFEMGSRIIITTRSWSVLDKADVKCKYEHKEMAEDESLVLFSRHAFRRDSPLCEFESLSRAVVSTTAGLPLALKVIGSLLYRKNQAFWQDLLKKLQKVPHEEVQEKLRISYEELNYGDKQIFLDIACFYAGINRDDIGIDVDEVSYMWDACNFYPKMGIETLSLMSLIKIEDNQVLNMHDQLRKLGREIVCQEDYNMPMNRSRLWVPEEALEVLQTNKGIEKDRVQALLLDGIESPIEITTEQLETLPNLRLLEVGNAKLIGDSKSLLPKLRSLFWMGCPAFVPGHFHLEKLVILNLQESDISDIWEGWSHLQVAKQLKVLILRYCNNLKITPDLSSFRNLEMLNLRGCENLEKIHPSIGEARGLVFLFLMGCKKLSKLPHEMGKLEELKELHIWGTAIQEIPACVGSLKKLQRLDASDCSSLVALPDSISHLKNLLLLDLGGCSGLCTLPKSIGSLVKLQRLSLSGTGVSIDLRFDYHIPNSIWKLEWLTQLKLSYLGICELSKSIGDLKNLEFLDISHCEKLSSLPSTIGKLGNLEELDASNCKNLGGEIHVDGLSSLKILRLSSTGVSGFHGTFDKVSCLEQLMLDDCHMLQSLPELPNSLTVLKVSGRHSTFPQLSRLIRLRKLTVKDCPLLKSMPELPLRLLKLSVSNCGELKELPSLSKLKLLSKLYLNSCRELTEIRGLEGLKSLGWLTVSKCWKLSNLDGLEHLESLGDLHLSSSGSILKDDQVQGFEKLKNLRFDYRFPNSIWKLECLTILDLSYSGICKLSKSIGDLKNLEFLDISHCEKLSSLPSTIGKLGNLEELDASNCKNLGGEIHIDGLSSLKILHLSSTGVSGFHGTFDKVSCLEQLMLDDCHMLQSLPELPTSLTVLEVSGQHRTFPKLSCLSHLRKLTVKDCPLLKSMPELPLRLLELFVRNCGELEELPSLSRLELLSKLFLESCGELTEIKGLEGLKSLAGLIVIKCWKLSNLDGLEHLESLRDLCLWSSGSILKDDQVRGFEKLKNLKRLVVVGCDSLVRVDVSQLTHLDGLDFHGCCKLLEIKGLERLKNLIKLHLAGCPIDTLPELSCLHNLELACVDERSNIPEVRGVRRAKYVGNGLYEYLPQ